MSENTGIAFTEEQRKVLLNSSYNGSDTSFRSNIPPEIKILSGNMQYKFFGDDKNNITGGMSGKLFIKNQSGNNTLDDLKDSIIATLIKISVGSEVREKQADGMGRRVSMGKMVPGKKDVTWHENWQRNNPGLEVENMAKLIFTPYTPEEVAQKELLGENPFCILVISGDKWGAWGDAQKEMIRQSAASDIYNHTSVNSLMLSVWKFTITSEKVARNGREWWNPVFKVEMNDPKTAFDMATYVMQFKDVHLFGDQTQTTVENEPVEQVDVEVTPLAEGENAKIPYDGSDANVKLFVDALQNVSTQKEMEEFKDTFSEKFFNDAELSQMVHDHAELKNLLPF